MTDLPILGPFTPLTPMPKEAATADAKTIVADAHAEAERITSEARAEAASISRRSRQRDQKIDTWAARVVIAAAVGLTASGEYELARKVGFDPEVAWLLPVVIDVYVIQAFRRHRDIAPAIGLTIAANVIWHLADAGLFGVKPDARPEWWLIAIVASIASLILWRMHRMTAPPRERQKRVRKTLPSPSESQASIVLTVAEEDVEPPASDGVEERQKTPVPEPRSDVTTGTTRGRQRAARKAAKVRRSMDEWVAVAEPIFHAEFARLRRNPTADEFATAIKTAGLGTVGTTTAKNIRAEILDRTDVPALTD
ncbi:hypothetical protein ACWENO_13855 [Streptomyces sp. NPDC004436]